MIYTLTLNPAIDMNIVTNGLTPNKVNRTKHVEYSPNGKGVNVSVVLKHYGVKSTIMGVFGGFSGRYIVDELIKMKHSVLPVWVEEDTRINVFANDSQNEFKFVSPGAFTSQSKQEEMLNIINQTQDMEYLIISGSLPPGIKEEFYHTVLKDCKEKGINIVLDISSPVLKDLLKYEPLLIKPNDEELKEVFDLSTENTEQVIEAMDILHQKGAKNVLLTMGSKGLYFSNGKEIYFCGAPKINLLSSACAGDSCLAAFLSSWLKKDSIEFSLKLGSATGGNVAESNGIGDLKKVSEYMEQINVIKIRGGL